MNDNGRPASLGTIVVVLMMALALASAASAQEESAQEDAGWPREFTTDAGTRIVVFQPQLDSLEGNRLSGRAAVSVRVEGADRTEFGAIWFDARIATDRDARMVGILEVQVPRVRFAEATPEQEEALSALLEKEVPSWDLEISLDRVLTALGVTEKRLRLSEGLNDNPPEILFETSPAILVVIEDEPKLQAIEGTDYQIVVNSPLLIIQDSQAGMFYLFAAKETWYEAREATGPWSPISKVPEKIRELIPEEIQEQMAAGDVPPEPPAIIVRTGPAELIVSDGEPEFKPLAAGELLHMSNTESDVLMEIASQRSFVLLSGRWFVAPSFAGPWSFVAADALPESFSAIEADSQMAHLRSWVAGTEEAKEAILDAQIPQTAAIQRDSTLEVQFDGPPQFEEIAGTELRYGVNTPNQVIQYQDRYYAVDNGVWFVAAAATGPWKVATEIPQAIYEQPASSPTYNTTFVYVYESTPSLVYVGYLPGYLYSFPYHGCLVWGTGWHHPAWWGRYWWPRHSTWGFHMSWSPYWGWGFGTSWSSGWFTFSTSWGRWGRSHWGWWGPVGFPAYSRGFNSGWAQGSRAGFHAGYRAGTRDQIARRRNLYDRPENRVRNAQPSRLAGTERPTAVGGRANNLYADRGGNVYRRNADGTWQQRQNGQWSSGDTVREAQARTGEVATGQRASSGRAAAGGSRGSRSNLNRDFRARQRGTARTQNFRSGAGRASIPRLR